MITDVISLIIIASLCTERLTTTTALVNHILVLLLRNTLAHTVALRRQGIKGEL